MRQNHDHGAALARDLGYTPVYLSYNSGLHISINGRAFAEALEALVAAWPVEIEDFVVIGHSMGGLVARSACRIRRRGGACVARKLNKLVFLGTPHHGAPLERIGNWVDVILGKTPYAAAFGRLGKIRSAGVTDLRYGNLMDEDWQGRDRFAREPDTRRSVPLPEGRRLLRGRRHHRQLDRRPQGPPRRRRPRPRRQRTRPPQGPGAGARSFPPAGNGSRAKRGTSIC